MTGQMLHLGEDPHRCELPYGRKDIEFGSMLPAGPPGSVWRCNCGLLWVVSHARWEPANWRTRWRYRKATTKP